MVFSLCPGILAFFFFTHRIRIIQDTAPPLNYYWVPILVWNFGDGWVSGEKEELGLTWPPLTGQIGWGSDVGDWLFIPTNFKHLPWTSHRGRKGVSLENCRLEANRH